MTRREFVEAIDDGCDIMFDLFGKSFTIVGGAENGPDIAEQITEANQATFIDGTELLKNYIVNSKTLYDCFEQIKVTHCT